MKCDICHQEAKSFVSYKISSKSLGVACHSCFNKMKNKGEIK